MSNKSGGPASLDVLAAAAEAAVVKHPRDSPGQDASQSPAARDVAVDPRLAGLDTTTTGLNHGGQSQPFDYGSLVDAGRSGAADARLVSEGPYSPESSTAGLRRSRPPGLEPLLSGDLEAGEKIIVVQPGTFAVSVPWHKHFYQRTFPENSDGEARERYLAAIRNTPWTKIEAKALKLEVIKYNKQRIQLDTGTIANEDVALHRTEGIDWEEIATSPDLKRRTPIECKTRWLQQEHPSINKTKWTKQELERLVTIANANGGTDWQSIAGQLNTNRTPVDCLKQFRARPTHKVSWTAAEDQMLKHAIRLYGENWQSVARMVGRHSNQCINRWTKTIRPHKKGKWSTEEDEDLLAAVAACGPVWSRVAARVSGRSDAQCRERFSNVLDPNINRQDWTPEEDVIIREQYTLLGGQWGKIVGVLKERLPQNGVRTDNKVMRRWEDLEKISKGIPLPKPRKRNATKVYTPRQSATKGRGRGKRRRNADESDDEVELDLDDEDDALYPDDSQYSDAENGADDADASRARKRSRLSTDQAAASGSAKAANGVPDDADVPFASEEEEEDDQMLDRSFEVATVPTKTRSGRVTKVRANNL